MMSYAQIQQTSEIIKKLMEFSLKIKFNKIFAVLIFRIILNQKIASLQG